MYFKCLVNLLTDSYHVHVDKKKSMTQNMCCAFNSIYKRRLLTLSHGVKTAKASAL